MQTLVDRLVQAQDAIYHIAAHANIRTSLVDHKAILKTTSSLLSIYLNL